MDSDLSLPLGKLEAFPCALLSVLLAFLDSGIASDQASVFERRPQVGIEFEQGSSYAVTNGSGLSRWTTAAHVDYQIKLVRGFRQLQRLANDHAQRFVGKIPVERLVINLDFAAAGSQIDPRRCRLPPSRSVILNFSHSNLSFLSSGPLILNLLCE